MFNQVKNINSKEEFEKQIKRVNECGFVFIFDKYKNQPIANRCYVDISETKCKLTYKLIKKRTYVFDLDGNQLSEQSVINACSQLAKAYKCEDVGEVLGIKYDHAMAVDGKPKGYRENIGSATPFKYYNKKYYNKEVKAYEYDLSSAYLQVLAKLRLPKLSTMKCNTVIGKNQVGFFQVNATRTGNKLAFSYKEGTYAQWVFDLTDDMPYKDWATKTLSKLSTMASGTEKDKIKNVPRYAVGQMQHHNPFIRCMVVDTCTKLIKSLMNEDTIYSNTDSIISLTRREDIENYTEYKFHTDSKHYNARFYMIQDGDSIIYQWNKEIPKASGLKKRYIERYNREHAEKFTLGTDEMPVKTNKTLYEVLFENNKLVLKQN